MNSSDYITGVYFWGAVGFIGGWIYAIALWGAIGMIFGWMMGLLVALVVGLAWPVILIGALVFFLLQIPR